MAIYAIGDIQGCAFHFEQLLEKIKFDPSRDQVWLTGDIVNRGPDSLRCLQLIRSLGESVISVLGNHDLHLLALLEDIKKVQNKDTLGPILESSDKEEFIQWLRYCPLLYCNHELNLILVHAGIFPGWTYQNAVKYTKEVESLLQGPDYREVLINMYGVKPNQWSEQLNGWERVRFIINACTRMRYCNQDGELDFTQKGAPGSQPTSYIPWFDHQKFTCQKWKKWKIIFGHWSSLGFMRKDNIISLDSGCVWGKILTAVRLDKNKSLRYFHIDCKKI